MNDQFHHDDLTSLENRRQSTQLYNGLKDMILGTERSPITVITALGCLFVSACNIADVDYDAALSQVAEALERGEFRLDDDPARGRYVHPAGHA